MNATFPIQNIGQIHITVDDLQAAITFYRDGLGLPILFEVPGQNMAFFDCGGVRLYLGGNEDGSGRSNPIIYYRVASIEEAHQALKARRVPFESEPHLVHRDERHELWMAGFRDPEGNLGCLMAEVALND